MTLLRGLGRNVSDIARLQEFYSAAFGFFPVGEVCEDPELAVLLGVEKVAVARMGLGAQLVELTQCWPPGAAYPRERQANDPWFQHIAVVTTDIEAACRRAMAAGAEAMSWDGPQKLPAASGGVSAWKFRDPDGHPLELLAFPDRTQWRGPGLHLGYDHSAISVADVERSITYYTALGLVLQHRQVNRGVEQDRLDGLEDAVVEVVAMHAGAQPPHVELLGYRPARRGAEMRANDLAADRLLFGQTALHRDPDGHFLIT